LNNQSRTLAMLLDALLPKLLLGEPFRKGPDCRGTKETAGWGVRRTGEKVGGTGTSTSLFGVHCALLFLEHFCESIHLSHGSLSQ
jgi:hypothetical protein